MIARSTKRTQRTVRYAVVGLGYIAQKRALPAFAHASSNSELAALVSDDPHKRDKLGQTYGVDRTFSYQQYDDCLQSGIDAVYLALPNSMHAEYAIRAAQAGIHVLTEKPMAGTLTDCRAMVDAAGKARVKLMVAYRLHFEKANLEALRIVRSGQLGEPRFFTSSFSMQVAEGNTRTRGELQGGSLFDLGIYCINAARTVFASEPLRVFAISTHHGRRFTEVDEMTSAVLAFPQERTAIFTSSFDAAETSLYSVVGTKGSLCLDPAYEESGTLRLRTCIGGRERTRSFPDRDQFAPEFAYFSRCILEDREPEPSGIEGLADVRVIAALRRSAVTGTAVDLSSGRREHAQVDPAQEMRRPPIQEPDLVHADEPSA